jgi:hypothetical protein
MTENERLDDLMERHRVAWDAWQSADENDIEASRAEEDAILTLALRPAANQAEFIATLSHILSRETRISGGDLNPNQPFGLLAICVQKYLEAARRT